MNQRLLALPAIAKNSPYCTIGAIECVLRYKKALLDLDLLYGYHTIEYRRGAELAVDAKNDLNVFIGRARHPELELTLRHRLLSRYGYRVSERPVTSMQDFRALVRRQIDSDEPFVSWFDLGFMPHRREYHNWYQEHFLVVAGYDESSIFFADQYDGVFAIPNTDIADCIARASQARANGFCWLSLADVQHSPTLTPEWREQVSYNLDNLRAVDGKRGLDALRRMHADALEFAERSGAWFGIPGLWTMAPERHGAQRWLRAIASTLPNVPASFAIEVERCFEPLVERWHLANRLCEKSFVSQSPRDTRRALDSLGGCLADEAVAVQLWATLAATFD